jgi:hypothetical protein
MSINELLPKRRVYQIYLRPEVLKLWGAPPPPAWGRKFIVWGTYLFWIKYVQGNIYILIGTVLSWNILLIA